MFDRLTQTLLRKDVRPLRCISKDCDCDLKAIAAAESDSDFCSESEGQDSEMKSAGGSEIEEELSTWESDGEPDVVVVQDSDLEAELC